MNTDRRKLWFVFSILLNVFLILVVINSARSMHYKDKSLHFWRTMDKYWYIRSILAIEEDLSDEAWRASLAISDSMLYSTSEIEPSLHQMMYWISSAGNVKAEGRKRLKELYFSVEVPLNTRSDKWEYYIRSKNFQEVLLEMEKIVKEAGQIVSMNPMPLTG